MKALARVVWSEGMHLSQHHFQAQSAYFEDITGATLSCLFHAPYGLLHLELDSEALLNGTAVLGAARGILPDGTPFAFPEEPPPDPLHVADIFSPMQSSHLLLLALPQTAPGRANTAEGEAQRESVRFSAVRTELPDETTGHDARPIQIARKNFRLLLDSGPTDGFITLPIARVQRDGAGHFIFDSGYIGPCLRVSANRELRELGARIIEMLESRRDAVMQERSGAAGALAEYAPREIAGFWLLHALNSASPPLRHSVRIGSAHPEQLYLQLSQLAGALCTFSMTSHPRALPAYDHDEPEACFRALERHIREHLEVILPSSAMSLAVRQTDASFFAATVEDTRCFEPTAQWFLGVRSSISASDLITRAPRLVKICSSKIIGWLAQKAHAGLTIEHVPVPPPSLSPRIGMQYFAIRRTDPCWNSLVETRELGLYIPDAISNPELEVKVVLDRP